MIIERFAHPEWLSNTFLVAEGDAPLSTGARGRAAVIIDSGGPVDRLLAQVGDAGLRVTHLLNTHHHVDHVAENRALKKATGARLGAHHLDAALIAGVDDRLSDGQVIRTGDLAIRVLHIPGHTAGQAAYLVNDEVVFTGDTLFRGSVGSTTAPGHTTFADLRRSIVERLMRLPEATRVAPGHAALTTIGDERAHNPFVRVMERLDPEGDVPARYGGRAVRLVVWARDYDAGFKAWIRLPDGEEATVPGSRVERARR